jgi:hypothetical protein
VIRLAITSLLLLAVTLAALGLSGLTGRDSTALASLSGP